jgi:two-component system nitrate/nitrite response regulator NarL
MRIIVVSSYAVIREGIVSIISKQENMSVQFVGETIKDSMLMIKGNMADVVLLDVHGDHKEDLKIISEIKDSGSDTKLMILDFYGDNEIFVKALKCGVQGYVLGKSSEEELLYAIDQIYRGKKYYDSYFIESMVIENSDLPDKLELLTTREKEILMEVSKGLSNKKISERFYITEHTVKKHINHIFEKLGIRDRTEAALYANKYGVLSK